MNQLPPDLICRFSQFLENQGIHSGNHRFYLKWLKFYLDFCQKYTFELSEKDSLSSFLRKLEEKNQPEGLRSQAHQSITFFWEMRSSENSKDQIKQEIKSLSSDKLPTHIKESGYEQAPFDQPEINLMISETANEEFSKPKMQGADWTEVYTGLTNSIKLRHYSGKTLKSYMSVARKFQAYLKSKDPKLIAADDVRAFLTSLAVEKSVSASSQNLAFNALLYLFRNVFGKEFGQIDGVVRAKKKPYIPVVLSRNEIDTVIGFLPYPYNLIIKLMYGCGLRISECLSLRVQNFNFDMRILTIHDGKGKKDRTVPIPEVIFEELKNHLGKVINLLERDCRSGYDGVFLLNQLEKKYVNASKELVWQWFFPARELTFIPETNQNRRYHVHESVLQKALRTAVKNAKIPKRVTSHTFRHSFASHLLQANYDIRTIQELMGHTDVRTTMIYTHTVKSITKKEAKSPLDF